MIFKLPHQKDKAISFIERIDKEMICEVRKDKRNRSTVQNAYYWFLLTMLEQETGNDKDSFHAYFKYKYLREECIIYAIGGNKAVTDEFETDKSTTKLTTIEFEDYLEKIRVFASSELGIFLPKPNETDYDYLQL